jgi:hypothetical protein
MAIEGRGEGVAFGWSGSLKTSDGLLRLGDARIEIINFSRKGIVWEIRLISFCVFILFRIFPLLFCNSPR